MKTKYFEYKFREELPLTPIGKIDYLSLEAEDAGRRK